MWSQTAGRLLVCLVLLCVCYVMLPRAAVFLLQICSLGSSSLMPGLATQWPDVATYWPEIAGDVSSVIWSHATNSQQDLDAALADATMMIEADVSLGEGGVPIMAHPPANTSDLTLHKFLTDVIAATADGEARKGVKLDFKDIEAVQTSLAMVGQMEITIPLWLNANVLRGPGDSKAPVDADRFLSLCREHLPRATLSLGWTTTAAPGQYSPANIVDLENLLEKFQPSAPITLPLRASMAAQSRAILVGYLSANLGTSLTIWSSKGDEVDVERLVMLIGEVGRYRVYVDVPQVVRDEMAALTSAAPAVMAGVALLLSIIAVVMSLYSNH